MAADELANVADLAEAEAHAQGYATGEPVHVLIGLLAVEDDPALSAARSLFERVAFGPRRDPGLVGVRRGRVPWSGGAQGLIDSCADRCVLRERLRARGPLLVQQFLADLDTEVAGAR